MVTTTSFPPGLTAYASVGELLPALQGWAVALGRARVPDRKLVDAWVYRSDRSGFPAHVSERWQRGRWVREYDVLEVLTWYVEYAPRRGGRPPGS